MARNGVSGVRMRHHIDTNNRNVRTSKVTSMIELFSNAGLDEGVKSDLPATKPVTAVLRDGSDSNARLCVNANCKAVPQRVGKPNSGDLSIGNRVPKPYVRQTQRPLSTSYNQDSDVTWHSNRVGLQTDRQTALNLKDRLKKFDTVHTEPKVNYTMKKSTANKPDDRLSKLSETKQDVVFRKDSETPNPKVRNTLSYWEQKLERNEKPRPNSVATENLFSRNFMFETASSPSPKSRLKSVESESANHASFVANRVKNFSQHLSSESSPNAVNKISPQPVPVSQPPKPYQRSKNMQSKIQGVQSTGAVPATGQKSPVVCTTQSGILSSKGEDKRMVNPLPKPVRTFTFSRADSSHQQTPGQVASVRVRTSRTDLSSLKDEYEEVAFLSSAGWWD